MPKVDRQALVPYSAGEMFELVRDVRSYPDFLPWCTGAEVLSEEGDVQLARLHIARGPVQQSFATRNILKFPDSIAMELLEGPFRYLQGLWRFEPLGEGACEVHLQMDFEFSSRVLELALGKVFKQITTSLVDAFCQRAVAVYGKR